MEVREMYNILHKKTDIHGDNPRTSLEYQIIKKYEAPEDHSQRRLKLKRGHYLEDQFAIKKNIPGPGTYNVSTDHLASKSQSRRKTKSEKKTYLDQVMDKSRKQKIPGPGKYQVLKVMGHNSVRLQSVQKRIKTENINYLDNAEYMGTLTPGVGSYDINRYQKSLNEQSRSKITKSPEFWKQKHRQQSLKILPTMPDAATYKPKPTTYQLFEQKTKIREFNGFDRQKNEQGRRLKTDAKAKSIGPGKYNIIHEWKKPMKNDKGLLDQISKGIPKRVYN